MFSKINGAAASMEISHVSSSRNSRATALRARSPNWIPPPGGRQPFIAPVSSSTSTTSRRPLRTARPIDTALTRSGGRHLGPLVLLIALSRMAPSRRNVAYLRRPKLLETRGTAILPPTEFIRVRRRHPFGHHHPFKGGTSCVTDCHVGTC